MSRQTNVQYPKFKIHSRSGAVQFTLTPAYDSGKTFDTKDGEVRILNRGHLMVEMANANAGTDDHGYTLYDWAGKVSMKMSAGDIQKILSGLQGADCAIVHDPNKAMGGGNSDTMPNSRFVVSKGERYGYFLNMSRGNKKVKCPVSEIDAVTLQSLLSRALVRIYGW